MSDDNKEQHVGQSLASSISNFTLVFYKNLASKAMGIFVSSALSAYLVLPMAAYGASGTYTTEQMRKVLHLSENDEQAHRKFQSLLQAFNAYG